MWVCKISAWQFRKNLRYCVCLMFLFFWWCFWKYILLVFMSSLFLNWFSTFTWDIAIETLREKLLYYRILWYGWKLWSHLRKEIFLVPYTRLGWWRELWVSFISWLLSFCFFFSCDNYIFIIHFSPLFYPYWNRNIWRMEHW